MIELRFNKPYTTGKELEYIQKVIADGRLSGNRQFTKLCQQWLKGYLGNEFVLLTHSGTAALEMTALLADIQPGDEVIMPSFTFSSTANAFVLRGGVPVFIDIRADTLNIDEQLIEAAITSRTKVIVPVHYAGVSCEMDAIMALAAQHNLLVIEDAAQGILAYYKGRALGSIGDMAAMSFHETKNVTSGEGGALFLNHPRWIEPAEILWEKGTNRNQFFRGEVDKYTWVGLGSSYLPSDLNAAFLYAQLEMVKSIIEQRIAVWETYHEAFAGLEQQGIVRRPMIPDHCHHNGHIYYLQLNSLEQRTALLDGLKKKGIFAVFHYVPLHSSPAGQRYGRTSGDLSHTNQTSDTLVRLPLWPGMTSAEIRLVTETTQTILSGIG